MPHNTIQKFSLPHKQGGATLIGMAFIAAALIFVSIVAMKMAPAYIEYLSVKKVLQALGREPLNTMGKKEIMDSFDRRASTSYVDIVTGRDITIAKDDAGAAVVSVQYQVVKPIVANVSVIMDFEASSNDK